MTDTSSGMEIAHWAVDAHNHKLFHVSCDPLKYDEHTRAWCSVYMDMDYQQGFLFTIYSKARNGADDIEVVDLLAVWDRSGHLEVEWWNNARLFFDSDSDWMEEGCRWFTDWLFDLMRDHGRAWAEDNPDLAASVATHNEKLQAARREQARAAGVVLPYFTEVDDGSDA